MKSSVSKAIQFIIGNSIARAVTLLLVILGGYLVLIRPVIGHIPPHPDEHQFYLNAWSIMSGKQLQNFLHVALTEYLLAGYLSFVNLFAKTGVNFPQGDFNPVTMYYSRIFGLMLYIATFLVGAILLQKDEKIIRPRVIIFAVLLFGSVGLFERFFRINSDSMSIFVTLNYILFSFVFHRRKAPLWQFFFLNLIFVFLSSFTNLKAMYMALPIFLFNTILPLFAYSKNIWTPSSIFMKIYQLFGYVFGIILGGVALWYLLIPKPVDVKTFWYNIKNATVRGVGYEFEYPTQAYNSWATYLYDLFVQQIGLTQLFSILVLIILAFITGRKFFKSALAAEVASQVKKINFTSGNLYLSAELIILLTMLSYYIGVSSAVIHWSRWGAPIGFFAIMLISVVLEHAIVTLAAAHTLMRRVLPALLVVLFFVSWSLLYIMIGDLKAMDYPRGTTAGYMLTTKQLDEFIKEKGFTGPEQNAYIAWFTGYTGNAGNISFEAIVDKPNRRLQYLIWPYWNIGPVYTNKSVDKEAHIQRRFIENYTSDVKYMFPTNLAKYMHYTKLFAWDTLGITWNPETDSMVEPQYAILKLKNVPTNKLFLYYEVPFNELSSHAYSTDSRIFSFKNLPDSYVFPTCATNPDVFKVTTGEGVPPPADLLVGGRTEGLYCHSLWFRVFPKGQYKIQISGLPEDKNGTQKVYSTLPFAWDKDTKTILFKIDQTRISAEFGVATEEKYIPGLNFQVTYYMRSYE